MGAVPQAGHLTWQNPDWGISGGCGCAAMAGSSVGSASVTPDERWLAAVWPFVRDSLPAAPA